MAETGAFDNLCGGEKIPPGANVDPPAGRSSRACDGTGAALKLEIFEMRYFMSIIPPASLKPGDVPQSLMDAMGPWMEKSIAAGSLISTGGLKPAGEGKRVRGHGKKIAITDGPFAEAKEVVGGYAVLEAPDMDAAAAIAGEFLQLHLDNGVTDVVLEVREIAGGANY
jgi:hypothetical protein